MALGEPESLAAQLRAFVTDWRRLQPSPPTSLTGRLSSFVEAWRALPERSLRQSKPKPAQRVLSVDRLAGILGELKPALEQARASGAYINVWQVAGLSRRELPNAAALAWLLQPRGNHGLGTTSLEGLFDVLQVRAPDCPRPSDLVRCSIRVEDRPMGSERDRVDLVVNHPELLLFIEIKVDSVEGPDQLRRYVEAAEETARLTGRTAWRVAYLTRSRSAGGRVDIIALNWRDVSLAIRTRVAAETPALQSHALVVQLLDHFAKL